ncbi:hypothetical protein PtA15_12A380 [Puccinia triticina]|uniref:Uncharacterized protein n=1 Tax=Puccinia triticina TaxID=208348 RepID=A0ABY7CYX0_9BASI|nr:uncharacterized protein PtA15_12A380 [Puccinia triticina]WAQ90391.1 hypothetical protein PtA15_12A380 [Puccinia triticina]
MEPPSKTVPLGPGVPRQTVWPYQANYKLENHEEWELEESDWGRIANGHVVEFSASDDEAPLSTLVACQNQPSGVVAGHQPRVVIRRLLVRRGSEGVEIKPVGARWSPSSHHLDAKKMVTQPADDALSTLSNTTPGSTKALLLHALSRDNHRHALAHLIRLDQPTHDFYPCLFAVCGQIGRGMGNMRKVAGLSPSPDLQTRIIKAYIRNLLRCNQPKRAYALLARFDFGPHIDLLAEAQRIGGRFAPKAIWISRQPLPGQK